MNEPREQGQAQCLPAEFFSAPTLQVARRLLGCVLVHRAPEGLAAGRIVETEAYLGPRDRGAHSYGGRMTVRNRAMFGEKGRAYIYFIYGMYWCFNVTTGPIGIPQAVLVRALEPVDGIDLMRARLAAPHAAVHTLCRGPGKLCKAMRITGELYGEDLRSRRLFVIKGRLRRGERVACAPRIGIAYAGEFAAKPWRFFIAGNPAVSGPKSAHP